MIIIEGSLHDGEYPITNLKLKQADIRVHIIERQFRFCILCREIEDEEHVIFYCHLYNTIRVKYDRLLSTITSIKGILNPRRDCIVEIAKLLYDIEAERNELNLQ